MLVQEAMTPKEKLISVEPTATVREALKLMRKHSPDHVQVKAAGGVRDLDKLLEVRALGVTRSGASQTANILDEAKRRLGIP